MTMLLGLCVFLGKLFSIITTPGLLTSHCVTVFSAPQARSASVEDFARLQARKIFHTRTQKARLRAKPG